MLSSIHRAVRSLSARRFQKTHIGREQEILQAIRWMHGEHVSDLRRLGYSAKEAFWLNLACLPFLPWDRGASSEMPLSRILGLYADLYRSTVDPLGPDEEQAFLQTLRQRYMSIRQVIARPDGGRATDAVDTHADSGSAKWAQAGQIVSETAEQWQGHRTSFPCRLVEDA